MFSDVVHDVVCPHAVQDRGQHVVVLYIWAGTNLHVLGVLGLAAASSGVDTAEVELATGHAHGAGGEEPSADEGGAAGLLKLELVGHLAAKAHGEASTDAQGDDAHSAVVGVGVALEGAALAAHLAAGAEEGVAADAGVLEATAGSVVVGHDLT